MTHIYVMSSHKPAPIRIYTGVLILGVNTLYRFFCFFKLFAMVSKGLKEFSHGFSVHTSERMCYVNICITICNIT